MQRAFATGAGLQRPIIRLSGEPWRLKHEGSSRADDIRDSPAVRPAARAVSRCTPGRTAVPPYRRNGATAQRRNGATPAGVAARHPTFVRLSGHAVSSNLNAGNLLDHADRERSAE
ncbi:hypothetical protein [Burkholderia sp. MSMB1498]|uniref:hypothetical protein n=1 Tax=Burkholderia sp. MSMB1498 TaxID=1637842 RepID=UPI00075992C7|nr:hypothetical protein [Burkholderia sp. MSMB1498]KVK89942.1 hypothetical protein WS91_27750 [Burkholderia sp. MSMB1498]